MQSSVPLCVTLKNAGGNMKVHYKANGIEFIVNNETMFIHVDHMFSDLPVTKARIDEFCGDDRKEAYGAIAAYTREIAQMVQRLKENHND